MMHTFITVLWVYILTINALWLYCLFTNKSLPNVYNEDGLKELTKNTVLFKHNGIDEWIIAKSLQSTSLNPIRRLKLALKVFLGELDVIDWELNNKSK